MSKFNYILGSDGITVFIDAKSYTVNRAAQTFNMVLNAVKGDDVDALRDALDIRKGIVNSLNATSDKVRIEGNKIFYGQYEVTGLITSRIFEMINLNLSVKPMIRFLENLQENPSFRAVNELFGFLDACKLPITEDGHFLAYKRVRGDYLDCYSGTMDNSVGKVLEVSRNQVDEDSERTCSYGLHVCSYDYLRHFNGDRIVVCKVNPRDVCAIPKDYNNSKMRVCRYEVVDEIPVVDYSPSRTIPDFYTEDYSNEDWTEDEDDWTEDEDDWTEDEDDWTEDEYGWTEDEDDVYDCSFGDDSRETVVSQPSSVSDDEVRYIRVLLDEGESLAQISRETGWSTRTIARIRDGERYADVQ